jgi:hypothetical protein
MLSCVVLGSRAGCLSLKPIAYTWSYLACIIGHPVPVWQTGRQMIPIRHTEQDIGHPVPVSGIHRILNFSSGCSCVDDLPGFNGPVVQTDRQTGSSPPWSFL